LISGGGGILGRKIKIVHINTYDREGGAARAAFRLHCGLKKISESILFVQNKTDDSLEFLSGSKRVDKIKVFFNKRADFFIKLLFRLKIDLPWSFNFLPFRTIKNEFIINADIIHLHWINGGFIGIGSFNKLNKPIVWTLHDSWPFTGGCHIPYECIEYQNFCLDCKQIPKRRFFNISNWVCRRKLSYYPDNMIIVCPSRWLAKCAKNSSVFANKKIVVIPNGIDTNQYSPRNKQFARTMIGIPIQSKVILFGAMSAASDTNKGFCFLSEAIKYLYDKNYKHDEIKIIIFGSEKPANPPYFGFDVQYVGHLNDNISLNILYSAADVMIVPSKSENFPNVILESMASGTPCVAFDVGGISELITHRIDGYLAKPYDSLDLAAGIKFVLSDRKKWTLMSQTARKKIVELYSIDIIAEKYINLYNSILEI
jgi:Glycosyltransferase